MKGIGEAGVAILIIAGIAASFYAGVRFNDSGWQRKAAAWLAEMAQLESERQQDAEKHRARTEELKAAVADLRLRLHTPVEPDTECQSLPEAWRGLWNVH